MRDDAEKATEDRRTAAETLTDNIIRTAKPVAGKRVELRDSGPWVGLLVRITSNGVKTFSYEYRRKPDGKKMRLTLGRYGTGPTDLTLATARRAMRQAVTAAPSGDPQGEKKAKRAEAKRRGNTVAELFTQWNDTLANRQRGWGKNSKRLYDQYIAPVVIGGTKVADMEVADFKRPHVHSVLDSAHKKARQHKRDGKHVAGNGARNQTLAVISAMLNYGIDRGDYGITSNEAARIKHLPVQAREKYLKRDQLGPFWHAACALTDDDERESLLLTMLLCQRGIQIRRLDWAWIELDFEDPKIEFPANSMKAKNRHVLGLPHGPGLALDILRVRHKRMGRPAKGPVFPRLCEVEGTGYQTMRRAQITVAASIGEDDANLHDWRRAMSNHTKAKHVSGELRSLVLAHFDNSTRSKHYEDAGSPDETREALTVWQGIILAATDPNKVVELHPAGRAGSADAWAAANPADVVTLRRPRQKPARTVKQARRG